MHRLYVVFVQKFSSDINAASSSADYKLYCFFPECSCIFHGIVVSFFSDSSLKTYSFTARPDKILKVFCSHQPASLQVQLCATSKLALFF